MNPLTAIDAYLESSKDMSELLVEQNSLVEEYNMVLTDLDHFLELEDLKEDEVARLTEFRKSALHNRRRAKDFVRVIDQILPRQMEGRTTQDRYEYAVRRLDERIYTPRKVTLEEVLDRSE